MIRLDDDIVDVDVSVATDLVGEALLHHALVRGTIVLETEGHCCVAVCTERCDEGRVFFVCLSHFDLAITRVGVEEAERL